MVRRVIAVVVGLLVGFVSVFAVESIAVFLYPLPVGFDPNDMEAMRRHVATLPVGAFLLVLVAHAVGCAMGALVCALIVRRRWLTGSLIIGCVFLLAGIVNLLMIPHPMLFAVADVLLYLPCSLLGGWAGQRVMGGAQ